MPSSSIPGIHILIFIAIQVKRADAVTGLESTVGQVPGLDTVVTTVEGLAGSLKRADPVTDTIGSAGLGSVVGTLESVVGSVCHTSSVLRSVLTY